MRLVSAQGLVSFEGNSYSVPPGLAGRQVTVRRRLGAEVLHLVTVTGAVVAEHRVAPPHTGAVVRDDGHVRALESAVLASFSSAPPCARKVRRPPSKEALAEAERLSGVPVADPAARVVIDMSTYVAAAGRPWRGASQDPDEMEDLKLDTAAEALNRVLDQARVEGLSKMAALERLMELEVEATENRRLASRLRFASLPESWQMADFDFAAQPGADEKLIKDLATLRFLDNAANILFVGPPGVGKTMLAVILARAAVEAGHRAYFTAATDLAAKCHRAALEGRWKTCMNFFVGAKILLTDLPSRAGTPPRTGPRRGASPAPRTARARQPRPAPTDDRPRADPGQTTGPGRSARPDGADRHPRLPALRPADHHRRAADHARGRTPAHHPARRRHRRPQTGLTTPALRPATSGPEPRSQDSHDRTHTVRNHGHARPRRRRGNRRGHRRTRIVAVPGPRTDPP